MGSKKRRDFGRVIKRSGRNGYYVRFRHEGREWERKGGPTKTIAKALLSEVHTLLAKRWEIDAVLAEVFGDCVGPNLTLKQAIPQYLEFAATRKRPTTLKSDTFQLNRVEKLSWAKHPMRKVRREDIQRWIDQMVSTGVGKRRPCSHSTANRYLATLSALFKWAKRTGLVDRNPVRDVERFSEKGTARELYLTAEEAQALLRASTDAYRPVMTFAIGTGCRRGEILSLLWRDVDLDKAEVYIRSENSKTHKGRPVPLPPGIVEMLRALRHEQRVRHIGGEDHVFRWHMGKPWTEKLAYSHYLRAVKACAELPKHKRGVRFHDLRHTYASLALQNGVPLPTISRILGHSCLQTTMRYAHWCPDDRTEAAERIQQCLGFGM